MILLDVQAVRKQFAAEPLLESVSFQVRPGDRIGLIGPNGCGKTTLLRILAGLEEPDAGSCVVHPAAHVGFLEQQPRITPGRSLRQEAAEGLAALYAIQQEALAVAEAIAQSDPAERAGLCARYDHLQRELERRDAYNVEHRIDRVLEGLGFAPEALDQPAETLSGGEQSRLMLAKLLLAEPNVMLLDEPSNHLDIASTEWLEGFLVECSAALVIVSHDRWFLDKVTNRTLELLSGSIEAFAGNFSAYRRQKAERLVVARRTYEKQQEEIAKAEEFIRRNAYGQKHAQAEDRRKKLERIVRVAPPREVQPPPMVFTAARRSGDLVLRAEGLSKAFARPLFDGLTFDVTRGQRWAILGPNGSGKTTLLACLLGLTPPDRGAARFGQGVELGYYDQRLAHFDETMPAIEAVRPDQRAFDEAQRRNLLARFGLTGDRVFQPVGSLSGGERCRLALARLSAAEANFLVLDEPTNHLDLWAREALENALAAYDGAVLVVSHDRQFLQQLADHLIVLDNGRATVFEGDFETYRRMSASPDGAGPKSGTADSGSPAPASARVEKTPRSTSSTTTAGSSPAGTARPGANRAGASRRTQRPARRFPYRKLADLEAEILDRETRVEEVRRLLADGQTHRNGALVRQLKSELVEHQQRLATLYEHWEEAVELDL